MRSIRSMIILSTVITLSAQTTSAFAEVRDFDKNSGGHKVDASARSDRQSARKNSRHIKNDSLTAAGKSEYSGVDTDDSKPTKTLSASVSTYDVDDSDKSEISKLTEAALKNDEAAKYADELIKKYSTLGHKAAVVGKEALYSMVSYRGFGPSKEGASIITENVKKIKTLPAAEYIKQRIVDDTHTKVVSNLLQIAMGLDCADKTRSDAMIATGYKNLKDLVGDEQATKTLNTLTGWSRDLAISKDVYNQPSWDVASFQKNVRNVTAISLRSDAGVAAVLKNVKKYNKGKVACAVSSMVNIGCSIGTLFAPGLLIPMATEMAQSSFIATTGGNEDTKLLNELYYAKALESRWKSINEESQLALTNYQLAVQTHSPTLMAASETVLNELVGSDKATKILGQSYLATLPNYSREKATAQDESRDKITAFIDSLMMETPDKKADTKGVTKEPIKADDNKSDAGLTDKDRSIAHNAHQ